MLYTPYFWPKLLVAIIPLGFAWYARRFREAPAALAFSRLMGLTALFALCHALNSLITSLPVRLWMSHVQVVPMVFITPATVALAWAYSGNGHTLTRRWWALLLAVPLLTILLDWTGAYHTFYHYHFTVDVSGATPVLLYEQGIWHWVHAGYMYLLLSISGGRLITAFPPKTPYFWNALVIALGIFLPYIVDFLYRSDVTPIPGYNFATTSFVFTGALQLWAIFRLRTFELLPIAHAIMLKQMREGIVVLDVRQRVVDVNPAAVQILGQQRGHLVGQVLNVPGLGPLTLFPTDPPGLLAEVEILQRWYQVSPSPLRNLQGAMVGGLLILRDITELKHTQTQFVEQQRALAMLAERVRLARELHDGLGQVLAYVKMRAQIARDLLAEGQVAEVDAYLANVIAVAQDAHTDIREYLLAVRAVSTPDTAFHEALKQYLAQFSRNYGIRTELAASDFQGNLLEPTAEVQLLRIIQEALTNTRKYAQAARVHVSLSLQEDLLHVVIQDDGQGFDTAQSEDGEPTYGLRFMRERAEELHGVLEVQSAPGQGARVIVKVPLHP